MIAASYGLCHPPFSQDTLRRNKIAVFYQNDSYGTKKTVSSIGLIGGAVLAGAGAVLVFTAPSGDGPASAAGWLPALVARLGEIEVPTLVMAGRDDFLFPTEHQVELAAGLANAHLQIIERAGHNAHEERPDEVIACVRDFVGPVVG